MIKLNSVNMIFEQNTVNENYAIKDINLTIKENDFITVIGTNGAGKSTLFNLISGNICPTNGKIMLNDKDITNVKEYKRSKFIGRIFQNPLLGTASNMTIEENMVIAYKKGFRGLYLSLNNKMRAIFKEELKLLDMNLEDRLHHYVGKLSGGQRQALTLLMMVVSKPQLILLDEHTAALDPKNASKVMELTEYFIKKYSLTAMMVTHNMENALKYGNRLLMMDKGRIILDISGEEKTDMTVEKLLKKFHAITNSNLSSDEILLSN